MKLAVSRNALKSSEHILVPEYCTRFVDGEKSYVQKTMKLIMTIMRVMISCF